MPIFHAEKLYIAVLQHLIGKRVRIEAEKPIGSARLLHGLTGTVIASHPIASDWVKIRLDANAVTPHQVWSVTISRLVWLAEAA